MPLTPQDVHSKVFGPTRFRRGYDEAEVDAFLDEVEAELTRLHLEIEALQSRPSGQGAGEFDQQGGQQLVEPAAEADLGQGDQWTGPSVATPAAGEAQAAAQSVSQSVSQSVGQSNGAGNLEQQVARTLVLAQRAADEAVRDAEQQAAALRSTAHSEAERIRLAAEQAAEEERRRVEQSRMDAEDDVEQLRAFEHEYRTRLRAYLSLQLKELDEAGAQVEARQSGVLTAGDSDISTPTDWPAGEHPGQKGSSGLLTSQLPSDDPATVPPLGAPSDDPAVPPSVPVPDYQGSAGVSGESSGEELRREPRDLHDGL